METIRIGMTGEAVRHCQELLSLVPDGVFGPVTQEAVMAFQRCQGLDGDGVVGPKTWALLEQMCTAHLRTGVQDRLGEVVNPLMTKRSRRRIDEVVVHCSATPEGRDVTVEQIRNWHLQRGWSDIGYHYVIYLDGSVHVGRDVDLVGAHTAGRNARSIGVCYVGGVDADGVTAKDTRTPDQKRAMVDLMHGLMAVYGLRAGDIRGHYEFAAKACPSFKIERLRMDL